MLLGCGELGKEVALELQRLGAEVIGVDRYANAPAMQVAHRSHVIDMLDADALRALIAAEQPDLVVPEIEAIATQVLAEVEAAGAVRVVPTARATQLTMNREGIRRLAAEQLGLRTSPYQFVDSLDDFRAAVADIGVPCVVKPVMSSSGKGQSVVRAVGDIEKAWDYAQTGGRATSRGPRKVSERSEELCGVETGSRTGAATRVIVEGFIDFDYEITMLTCRYRAGVDADGRPVAATVFCDPVGHVQVDGDYRESWQPAPMSDAALAAAQRAAGKVTAALCAGSDTGWGLFGVELFVVGDEVIFNEVSPRPHDTGLVTLVSQDVSEFGLHARAVLGLPVETPNPVGGAGQEAAASCAVLAEGTGVPVFAGVDGALAGPTAQVRLFAKPRVDGKRRVAVTLARGADVDQARARAREAATTLTVTLV
jgi:phosphoribosylglycinamide formyltransferase 2